MSVPAFTREHVFNGKTFRVVPGFEMQAASEDGEILRLDIDGNPKKIVGQYRVHNTRKDRRSKDTFYLNVAIITNEFIRRTTASHILVCLAWNGLPPDDGIRYDVNHKNSIKTDNRAVNLEWSTRSQNIEHCFDEGKNAAAVRIIQKNVDTGEEKIFRSIKNFSEVMNIFRIKVRKFIASHREVPHNGYVYSIEEPRNFRIQPVKYQTKQVAFKNYETNSITFTKSIEQASELTGIYSASIRYACDRFKDKRTVRPMKNYFFQYLTDNMIWPDFSNAALSQFAVTFERRSKATTVKRKHKSLGSLP